MIPIKIPSIGDQSICMIDINICKGDDNTQSIIQIAIRLVLITIPT